MLSVLIAEDNVDIAENIADYLEVQGYQIDYAYDGKMVLSLCQELIFDVIIMDVMMPKLDGFAATKALRESPHQNANTPILMLTAKDTIDDKLAGFGAGADDYLLKPFAMAELYARLQALVRKHQQTYQQTFSYSGIELNHSEQTESFDDKPINLNPTTFKMLYYLAKNALHLVAKNELEFQLWGDLKPETDLLRSHIYNLRKALAKNSRRLQIVAKHGQGYRLSID
ncbi:response regulator transcription factor [Catenovulum sp. SM1970]|uniref:response regulator transcription factor n=1 Tax=Marinifaba aquimaris TaxID=2741323 RepID=UPI00157224CD|nr:response regulator transcription factor [Marinifaba aquimaris]NTS75812.1 response regulator transcription factor [Marinifaba aquimaris]